MGSPQHVLAWIHRSISDSIARLVLWIDTVVGVWKNLRIRFSQGDIFRISDIQEELYKFRQGNLDISDFFTQLKVYGMNWKIIDLFLIVSVQLRVLVEQLILSKFIVNKIMSLDFLRD
jgi:hypothetical protein